MSTPASAKQLAVIGLVVILLVFVSHKSASTISTSTHEQHLRHKHQVTFGTPLDRKQFVAGADQVPVLCNELRQRHGIKENIFEPKIDEYEDAKKWIMLR